MNVLSKVIINSLLCMTMISSNIVTFYATQFGEKTDISEKISELIPESAINYAEEHLEPLAKTVQDDKNYYNVSIENVYELQLGTPYIVYSADDLGVQEPIYYFPVLQNDDIILVLSVAYSDGYYSAGISESMSKELNEINYQTNNDYIFYEYDDKVYASSETGTEILVMSENYQEKEDNNFEDNTQNFSCISLDKKINQITKNYAKKQPKKVLNNNEIYYGALGFAYKNANSVKLYTTGCEVYQGNRNTCWAASVAFTVRYLKYSLHSTLTDVQVCRATGVSVDGNGGTIYDMKYGLSLYGVNYGKVRNGKISFDTIKNNILSQNTILVGATSGGYGHAVTVVGYATNGGIKQVTFYNSGTDSYETVEYLSSGTRFSYGRYVYTWSDTLAWK